MVDFFTSGDVSRKGTLHIIAIIRVCVLKLNMVSAEMLRARNFGPAGTSGSCHSGGRSAGNVG